MKVSIVFVSIYPPFCLESFAFWRLFQKWAGFETKLHLWRVEMESRASTQQGSLWTLCDAGTAAQIQVLLEMVGKGEAQV